MSFSERALLWLHIGVVIFTIGPVTAAIMSTPRYIRKRNTVIVGYLYRVTRIYAIASLLLFVFGIVLADMLHDLSKPWLSISMTLYVVALVLLVLILRDQRKAAAALASVTAPPAPAPAPAPDETAGDPPGNGDPAGSGDPKAAGEGATPGKADESGTSAGSDAEFEAEFEPAKIAAVERGRIASLAGVTSIIWLVILVLMIWR